MRQQFLRLAISACFPDKRPGIPSLFPLIALVILLTSAPGRADDPGYADDLVARAATEKLADDRQWQTLLHFEGGGSKAAPGYFFLSPLGRRNPQAELEATLRAFFSSEELPQRHETAQCAFPARYLWLKGKLSFDPQRLPAQACPMFESWYGGIRPHRLTLILASSYMNNPASAFGHTLLRIDRIGSDPNSRLLDYAVNYAAATDDANALLYAVKGIAGGYDGFFSVGPYYEKVRQYSDLENRDIWEYPLNLTTQEADLLVRHLWELQGVPFPYYYFDENCSYQLLSLLEAARPALKLRSQFQTWVVPVDTARAVVDEAATAPPLFRPSAATKLQNRINRAGPEVRRLAKKLAESAPPPAPTSEARAESLDLANEYLAYLIIGTRSPEKTKELTDRAFTLLGERSLLNSPDNVPAPPAPSSSPEEGHPARKLSFSGGLKRDQRFFQLSFRPAYHDLLDPEAGYAVGSQISMLRADLGLPDEKRLRLERFDLLDLASITPRNLFLKPTSWYFRLGAERSDVLPHEDDLIYVMKGGGGFAWAIAERSLVYTLAGPATYSGRHLEDSVAFGVGARLGALLFLTDRAALLTEAGYERILPNNDLDVYTIEAARRYSITPCLAARFSQKFVWSDSGFSSRYLLSVERFF